MNCDTCRARRICEVYVQPGSVMCTLHLMQAGGTKGGERENERKLDALAEFCPYCGHPLKIIGTERFCNNAKCLNRYKPV